MPNSRALALGTLCHWPQQIALMSPCTISVLNGRYPSWKAFETFPLVCSSVFHLKVEISRPRIVWISVDAAEKLASLRSFGSGIRLYITHRTEFFFLFKYPISSFTLLIFGLQSFVFNVTQFNNKIECRPRFSVLIKNLISGSYMCHWIIHKVNPVEKDKACQSFVLLINRQILFMKLSNLNIW